MKPVKITLQEHYRGDTWEGLGIGPLLINGLQPVNALASCKMQFRDNKDVLGAELTSLNPNQIEIIDPETWEVIVPEQQLPLTTGDWSWDIEFVDSTGRVKTYFTGVLVVIKDYTHE